MGRHAPGILIQLAAIGLVMPAPVAQLQTLDGIAPFFMPPLVAILELGDYALIAFIVIVVTRGAAIFTGGATFAARQRLELRRLERKLDALLKHQGIQLPSEVELLAKDPNQKIAAIKLYLEENPGVSLSEAKARVEEIGTRSQ